MQWHRQFSKKRKLRPKFFSIESVACMPYLYQIIFTWHMTLRNCLGKFNLHLPPTRVEGVYLLPPVDVRSLWPQRVGSSLYSLSTFDHIELKSQNSCYLLFLKWQELNATIRRVLSSLMNLPYIKPSNSKWCTAMPLVMRLEADHKRIQHRGYEWLPPTGLGSYLLRVYIFSAT